MNILALDQASNVTGWAIFNGDRLDSYGKIDLHTIPDIYLRIHELKLQVKTLIQENNIDKIILEDIYMDGQKINNVQTFKILAEVFGVLYELCLDLNKPVDAILAGTWKSALGIKGKTRPEQKRAAQVWVNETYGIKPIQDICDAICIGKCAIQQSQFEWGE